MARSFSAAPGRAPRRDTTAKGWATESATYPMASSAMPASSSARFRGDSLAPMMASIKMSAATMRSRSAARPMTKPTAAQAFSGAVAMGTTTGAGATGACSPRGLMSSGPHSFAAKGARYRSSRKPRKRSASRLPYRMM